MAGSAVKYCEDTLTSSIFGQLLYLPTELMWGLLRQAVYSTNLPQNCGRMDSYQFWPKWDSAGTTNRLFVEPDLFFRFTEFDLIIEAKRWDANAQYRGQWEAEIRAYRNEYAGDQRRLYFIALGGLRTEKSERVMVEGTEYEVVMCRWSRILRAAEQAVHQLDRRTYSTSSQHAHMRVLDDLISYFGLHGYATGIWLEDVNLAQWHLSPHVSPLAFRFATHG